MTPQPVDDWLREPVPQPLLGFLELPPASRPECWLRAALRRSQRILPELFKYRSKRYVHTDLTDILSRGVPAKLPKYDPVPIRRNDGKVTNSPWLIRDR